MRQSLLLFSIICICSVGFSQRIPENATPAERLAAVLKRFPDSDANKDGVLSREEAGAFFLARRATAEKLKDKWKNGLVPDHADVSYGDHEKQAFDIWLVPDAVEPTPFIVFIHGGGFRGGDKSGVLPSAVERYLQDGIAFVSMNYRLSDVGPYPIMMEDAARGLQTIRSRASEWNLDPEKVACYGGSAGAGISLWLGFHEDLADPDSEDPISRQSTRIVAAGTTNGQSTYDMNDFREWFGRPNLKPDSALPLFYNVEEDADWESDRVKNLMTDASPINHLTKDDVPVYMIYSRLNTDVTLETTSSEWVHHVKLGLKLQEKMNELGVECLVTGPDVIPENDPYGTLADFLITKLKE